MRKCSEACPNCTGDHWIALFTDTALPRVHDSVLMSEVDYHGIEARTLAVMMGNIEGETSFSSLPTQAPRSSPTRVFDQERDRPRSRTVDLNGKTVRLTHDPVASTGYDVR